MTKLDDLLNWWAEWLVRREDNGLGYKACKLNVLMGGGVAVGRGFSDLPYGLDINSVGAVVDGAVCRLTPRRREVIMTQYCQGGTQSGKAAGMRPPVALKTYENILRNARMNLLGDKEIKKLLRTG